LKVSGLVANTEAVKVNRRYVDEDLNRCFTLGKLSEQRDTYEAARAAELNALLGPKGNPKVDFIFDLHNTTSNTGMMLCFHQTDSLAREVASHLNRVDPKVRLVHWPKGDQPFLPTIGRSGVTVEFGPVAHGTVHSPSVERVFNLLMHGLEYLDRLNLDKPTDARETHTVSIGERIASIDFPRNPLTDDALSFLHPRVQDIPELQDGSYLRPGQPVFSTVDGKVAETFDPAKYGLPPTAANEKLYPVFVNEAAYFEKHTAFFLYHRIDGIKVSLLPRTKPASTL
jgi:succinylglutamate desuccinylase